MASGGKPQCSKSRSRSWNWPWMSPTIWMGASNSSSAGWLTVIVVDSSMRKMTSSAVRPTFVPGFSAHPAEGTHGGWIWIFSGGAGGALSEMRWNGEAGRALSRAASSLAMMPSTLSFLSPIAIRPRGEARAQGAEPRQVPLLWLGSYDPS